MSNKEPVRMHASFRDALSPESRQTFEEWAKTPMTLEEKLDQYNRMATEVRVLSENTKKWVRRSELGTLAYTLFNGIDSKLMLPPQGRQVQIQKAVAYGREYLINNPEVGILKALFAGAATEYKEWKYLMQDLTPAEVQVVVHTNKPQTQVVPEERQ